ncbi:MAG: TRAP-type C4-dicarboxylate transport system permease small subunit [Kiritimatiellia bacterium]|jgi:TRAP-type C4-dicarboxylate transport system permease small subunit
MNLLKTLEDKARKLSQTIALFGLVCLLIQASAIFIDVLLRWLFNSPLFGMEDINQLLLAVILASFFPALLVDSKNVTIDFLGRSLGPKIAAWLDVFGHVITLLLFTIVSWQLAVFSAEVHKQTTLILQLPVSPSWWLATSLITLCIPIQMVVTALHIQQAIGNRQNPITTKITEQE